MFDVLTGSLVTNRLSLAIFLLRQVVAFGALAIVATAESVVVDLANEQRLTLLSANVFLHNERRDELLQEIESTSADVVLIQEFSPSWQRTIEQSNLLDTYPHGIVQPRDDAFGQAVFSRIPILASEVWETGGMPVITFRVGLSKGSIRVFNWHPFPPIPLENFQIQSKQYEELVARLVQSEGLAIVVGDFNVTQHSPRMKELREIGFHSAHEETGRGAAVTFPNGQRDLPSIRIDHAMLSKGLKTIAIREGEGAGSDHKPLILEVAIEESTDN